MKRTVENEDGTLKRVKVAEWTLVHVKLQLPHNHWIFPVMIPSDWTSELAEHDGKNMVQAYHEETCQQLDVPAEPLEVCYNKRKQVVDVYNAFPPDMVMGQVKGKHEKMPQLEFEYSVVSIVEMNGEPYTMTIKTQEADAVIVALLRNWPLNADRWKDMIESLCEILQCGRSDLAATLRDRLMPAVVKQRTRFIGTVEFLPVTLFRKSFILENALWTVSPDTPNFSSLKHVVDPKEAEWNELHQMMKHRGNVPSIKNMIVERVTDELRSMYHELIPMPGERNTNTLESDEAATGRQRTIYFWRLVYEYNIQNYLADFILKVHRIDTLLDTNDDEWLDDARKELCVNNRNTSGRLDFK